MSAAGYVPKVLDWQRYELGAGSNRYTIHLDRGRTVAGVVQDGSGGAISLAKIHLRSPGLSLAQHENVAYHPRWDFVMSDDQGRWAFNQAPGNEDYLTFFVTHPEYAKLMVTVPMAGRDITNAVFAMNPGASLTGFVVATNGWAIAATVEEVDTFGGPDQSSITDHEGQFWLAHVNPGPLQLRITALGYTTLSRTINAFSNAPEQRFVLAAASLPSPPPVGLSLSPPIHVAGKVIDGQTGEPVRAFKVLVQETVQHVLPRLLGEGKDGQFDWQWRSNSFVGEEYLLEVQADGYLPEATLPTKLSNTDAHFELRLKKSAGIAGQILLSDRHPATGAEVFLSGKGFRPSMAYHLVKGPFLLAGGGRREVQTRTDAQGRFQLKPARLADSVVVNHPFGGGVFTIAQAASGPLILQPWGRIEGTLRTGGVLGTNLSVGAKTSAGDLSFPYSQDFQTDEQGRFHFERVPPGFFSLFRVTDPHPGLAGPTGASHELKVEVKPGQTTTVILGGHGRTLVGRLRAAPDSAACDWTLNLQKLVRESSGEPYYLTVERDGTFSADDVPAGNHQLEVHLTQPPADPLNGERFMNLGQEIGSLTHAVVVLEPAPGREDEAVDLGTIVLPVKTAVGASR